METISTAFMGMTVGCAKCHDHKFDPITQKDFYAMKAIFDPLVLKNVMLATPAEIFANGEKLAEYKQKNAPIARGDRSADRALSNEAVRRARGAADARRAGDHPQDRSGSARPQSRRSSTTIIRCCASIRPRSRRSCRRRRWRSTTRCSKEQRALGNVPRPAFLLDGGGGYGAPEAAELHPHHRRSEAAGEGQAGGAGLSVPAEGRGFLAMAAAKVSWIG